MKGGFIPWRNSIFSRLFVIFILIILPLYIIGITIYNLGIRTLRDEISNSMTAQLSFYLNNLDKEIQGIKKAQFECLSDDDLNQLASIPEHLDTIEKRRSILNLQHRLVIIMNSSTYIKSVSAHIPALGKSIYGDGAIEDIDYNKFKALKIFPNGPDSQIIYWNNRLFLSALYPIASLIKQNDPLFIIEVELSMDALKKALMQFNGPNGGGAFLYNPSNHFSVISHDNVAEYEGIMSQIDNQLVPEQRQTNLLHVSEKTYLATSVASEYLGMTLTKYLPDGEMLRSLKEYQIWFWILTIIAIAILILLLVSIYRLIQRPLLQLVGSFRKVEHGDLNIKIESNKNDEFGYLYRRFNTMTQYLSTLVDQVYKQKILTQKAELKQLQSQINPHFLYNSFFIISGMVRTGDYDNLEQLSTHLGEYYKFITRNNEDEVPLYKEVDHARTYTEIQSVRFANRIQIIFDDLPVAYASMLVPRLIIQPIIENAFEHGLEKKARNGVIRVGFEKKEDGLCIIVEDNGESIEDEDQLIRLQRAASIAEDEAEVTAIVNINRRIQLKFGQDSGVTLSRGTLGGLKVEIRILQAGEERHV